VTFYPSNKENKETGRKKAIVGEKRKEKPRSKQYQCNYQTVLISGFVLMRQKGKLSFILIFLFLYVHKWIERH
jgi:hypothetical protein